MAGMHVTEHGLIEVWKLQGYQISSMNLYTLLRPSQDPNIIPPQNKEFQRKKHSRVRWNNRLQQTVIV